MLPANFLPMIGQGFGNVLEGALGNAAGSSLFGGEVGTSSGALGDLFGQIFNAPEGIDLPELASGESVLSDDILASIKDVLGSLNLGSASDVEALGEFGTQVRAFTLTVVEIKQVVVQFEAVDVDLSEVKTLADLSSAFEVLGLSSEFAEQEAARFENMLAFVSQELGIEIEGLSTGEGESFDLGAGLLQVAASATAVQQVSVQVAQLAVRETAFTQTISAVPVTDVASLVLADKPLLPVQERSVRASQTEALAMFKNQMADIVQVAQDLSVEEGRPVDAEVPVQDVRPEMLSRADGGLGAGRSEAAVAALTPEAVAAVKPTQNVRDNRRYQPVETQNVLKAPEGTEVYKWQTTAAGLDVVQQVAAFDTLGADAVIDDAAVDEILVDLKQGAQGKIDETTRSDNRLPFAERLMQAAKAQVTQQVGAQIQTTAQAGGGTVRMQLNPAELGRVEIEIEVINGRVHGAIAAERPEVLEQMARELQVLKQSLADAGFSLGENGMSLMLKQDLNENGDSSNDTRSASSDDEGSPSENIDSADGAGHAPQRWIAPDRFLDVNV